jgi:hypothetical protein
MSGYAFARVSAGCEHLRVARRVLIYPAMSRSLLAAVIVVAATGTAASAGTYVGLGIGNSAVSDTYNNSFTPDGRSGRLMLGARLGNFSLEGAFTGYSLLGRTSMYDSRTLSAALKLNIPLGNRFEAFGRVGVLRTYLSPTKDTMPTYSGDGYTWSAGFEYRVDLGLAGGSLFVDYTRNNAKLTGGPRDLDQTASMWSLGLLVSI